MENLMQALGFAPSIVIEICGGLVSAWPVSESVASKVIGEAEVISPADTSEWFASTEEEINELCEGLRKLLQMRREYLMALTKLDNETEAAR